jgi:hypothetical protein
MRILQLTNFGEDIAKSPTVDPSDRMKILYFMRRRNGKATDDQLNEFVIPDRWMLQKAIRKLKDANAIIEIGKGEG